MKSAKNALNKQALICKRVRFYSKLDEHAFFEWIKKIKCIASCEGVRDTIVLTVVRRKIKNEDLCELFAIFRRYKIRTEQLEVFLDSKNHDALSWFKKNSHFNMYPAKPTSKE